MAIEITYKVITYPSSSKIYRLTNLIKNNNRLLIVIGSAFLLLDKVGDKRVTDVSYNEKLAKSVKRGVLAGLISAEVGEQFLEMWLGMRNEELGRVLEQIIANNGPWNTKELREHDKSMEVKIKQTGKENDFDVVFFNKRFSENSNYGQAITIDGYSEFYECKKNICTFVPANPNKKIEAKVRKKLEFIRESYLIHNCGAYYIPTFFANVKSQRRFLTEYENGRFEFIKILNIEDLIERICYLN